MFSRDELSMLAKLTKDKYNILAANGHDVTLQSIATGHEWIIITDCGNSRCRIRHRHSRRDPFHEQRGRYETINGALAFIEYHDEWFAARQKARQEALAELQTS